MQLDFGEGFNFYIESLSVGHIVIRLNDYKQSEASSRHAVMYHKDYYIKTDQKIRSMDSLTLKGTVLENTLDSNYRFNYLETRVFKKRELKEVLN